MLPAAQPWWAGLGSARSRSSAAQSQQLFSGSSRRTPNSKYMTTIARMNLNILPQNAQKRVVYNLKNSGCQKVFQKNTSSTKDFTESVKTHQNVQSMCEKWKRTLDSHVNKAFRKMRVRKSNVQTSELDKLINKRNKLKKNKHPHPVILKELDSKISEFLIKEGVCKANQFQKLCDLKSTIPLHQLWKL